ncbi:MAG: DegT/DnrJ/EryC1/StrS family aminotransferase [Candidatus Woesearchaeota archaeon]|jgi:dTDP-4-amino-4,6-dideoxygalactose transaminase|nr:DegT/DnrJ/EryC1/StrS family aminotransferase [Candidatus Woesearchaeota archaeon]MDP7458285.1 DegT/DnrJ/EryC1/StrS family aminotransferase [Candidatus Woesearchaeota archaeon]
MEVPFVDLKKQYKSIKKEIDLAIHSTLDNTAFIMGESVEKFEKEFAHFCKVDHCVSASSGTSALYLALRALGIGQGDEVILPSHTFIGSAEPITLLGATPVFVDIDKDTYQISPKAIIKAITPKTKAIMPVHLYGLVAPMKEIMGIAKEHSLFVVEDACQAHGALYDGKSVGSIGDIGCFSFYPGKNLGCYGDGGALVTNNKELAVSAAQFRDHGRAPDEKYIHDEVGFNFRMDALQAVILSVKLKKLPQWNDLRRKHVLAYNTLLGKLGTKVETAAHLVDSSPVFHLYVIQCEKRDSVQDALKEKGISTGVHYPIPLHLQPAFKDLGYKKGSLPVTEKIVDRILSLPLFPELEQKQIEFVCEAIKDAL